MEFSMQGLFYWGESSVHLAGIRPRRQEEALFRVWNQLCFFAVGRFSVRQAEG